jgi:hypothetical protein
MIGVLIFATVIIACVIEEVDGRHGRGKRRGRHGK